MLGVKLDTWGVFLEGAGLLVRYLLLALKILLVGFILYCGIYIKIGKTNYIKINGLNPNAGMLKIEITRGN